MERWFPPGGDAHEASQQKVCGGEWISGGIERVGLNVDKPLHIRRFWNTVFCCRTAGIGVDYALYVLSICLKQLRAGASLSDAYHKTLLFTGKVVLLTGFTLAASVATWVFAPIKFQADMGLLLSFMFIWNMLGALILLPSLAVFLLPPSLIREVAVHTGGRPSSTRPEPERNLVTPPLTVL